MPRCRLPSASDVEEALLVALAPLSQPTEVAMIHRHEVASAARRAGDYLDLSPAWALVRAAERMLGKRLNRRDRLNLRKVRLGVRNVRRRIEGRPPLAPDDELLRFMTAPRFVPAIAWVPKRDRWGRPITA